VRAWLRLHRPWCQSVRLKRVRLRREAVENRLLAKVSL
jgi:hypothetical protein